MRTRCCASKNRSLLIFLLLLLGLLSRIEGQATSNANQIVGTIELTNANPEILSVLEASGAGEGFWSGTLDANSLAVSPTLNNRIGVNPETRTRAPFEISVEAGPDGSGIEYNVQLDMVLDFGGDIYRFASRTSPPVVEEPAADVVVDFRECVALLDVTFVNSSAIPVAVDGGFVVASREKFPGSGAFQFQAQDSGIQAGSSQEYLAIRGDGSDYEVEIRFAIGTDFFFDRVQFSQTAVVTATCDAILPIVAVVPEVGELGEIVGIVDLLGIDENRVGAATFLRADSGPFGNFRFETVDVPTPSQGPFVLENMMPSDATTPATKYRVFGDLNLGLGRRNQNFRLPFVRDVAVSAGRTTDLGSTFVIEPGFVRGDIFLTGPPPGPFGSCLEHIVRGSDRDANGDGIPDHGLSNSSLVSAFGLDLLATGASRTAAGGVANVLFEGDYDPAPQVQAFAGDYELVLGGLSREPSIWNLSHFRLQFEDRATPEIPESYLVALVDIFDLDVPDLEIVPGGVLEVPIRHCFGRLNLGFASTTTDFFSPNVQGTGTFSGLDFESNPAQYSVRVRHAFGTPAGQADAAREGLAVACIPEGNYDLTPFVQSVNPGGGTSRTELPPILDVEIECRQIKNLTLGLEVKLDPLAVCTAEPTATLSGSAEGTGDAPAAIAEIFARVNGGPPIVFCTDCGDDPAYAFDVPLAACDNQVEVVARDDFDNVSSTLAATRFDPQAPVLTGCDDVVVEIDPSATGAIVDFTVAGADGCDGGRPVSCDVPSGSYFPKGSTEVTCASSDDCGNTASCTFTVSACPPEGCALACSGDAFVVRDVAAELGRIDPADPLAFGRIGDLRLAGGPVEVNNLGLRIVDGFLYGLEVDLDAGTNSQVVRIDGTGKATGLGRADGLPDDVPFNAGDVSTDGSTLFLSHFSEPVLWAVELTQLPALPPATAVAIVGPGGEAAPEGIVLDWAYHPVDGKLYGGDRDGVDGTGQVAQLDPATGERRDFTVPGLPGGALLQYGGAWLDASGRLFLLENAGTIYEIELGANLANPVPKLAASRAAPASARNDAAACVPDVVPAPREPFPCDGEIFLVQERAAELLRVDTAASPFVFDPVGEIEQPPGAPIEVNNVGLRSTDGLLYGVEVDLDADTNVQVVQIDAGGAVIGLGRPSGLPADVGFNAGDVSSDGTTLFLSHYAEPRLWSVDLTSVPSSLGAAVAVPITGAGGAAAPGGIVLDWAYNPADGKLYGGDRDGDGGVGEIAQLDPLTGERRDFMVPGLPGGAPRQYGGAWFDGAGRLFLIENSGTIYEVDLGSNPANPAPTLAGSRTGPGSSRNDAASCH